MGKKLLILSVLYSILIIFLFDTVTRLSDRIFALLGREVYDLYIVEAEIAILFPLALLVAWGSLRTGQAAWKLSAWALYFLCLYVSGSGLITNRIEHIHYPEYAILGILLFGAYRRYLPACWAGSLIGLLDEFLQIFRHQHPLEVNDVFFDIMGVVGGLLLCWTLIRQRADIPSITRDK